MLNAPTPSPFDLENYCQLRLDQIEAKIQELTTKTKKVDKLKDKLKRVVQVLESKKP